jgi:hypothetical protein
MSGTLAVVTSLGSETTLYGKWTSCQNGAETSSFYAPAVIRLNALEKKARYSGRPLFRMTKMVGPLLSCLGGGGGAYAHQYWSRAPDIPTSSLFPVRRPDTHQLVESIYYTSFQLFSKISSARFIFYAMTVLLLGLAVASLHAAPVTKTVEIAPGVNMPRVNCGGTHGKPSNYTAFFDLGGRGVDTALECVARSSVVAPPLLTRAVLTRRRPARFLTRLVDMGPRCRRVWAPPSGPAAWQGRTSS